MIDIKITVAGESLRSGKLKNTERVPHHKWFDIGMIMATNYLQTE